MADLEEKIINAFEEKPVVWLRYRRHCFIWEHGEESLEKAYKVINCQGGSLV